MVALDDSRGRDLGRDCILAGACCSTEGPQLHRLLPLQLDLLPGSPNRRLHGLRQDGKRNGVVRACNMGAHVVVPEEGANGVRERANPRVAVRIMVVRGMMAIVLGVALALSRDRAPSALVNFMGVYWLLAG